MGNSTVKVVPSGNIEVCIEGNKGITIGLEVFGRFCVN